MPADFETSSAKKDTNEIHINVLRRWQACKLKRGDATLAVRPKEMSFELNEGASARSDTARRVCVHAHVCASAVCSDQTHWCVIGSPLSRWPLRLECLPWWRTGRGRTDDNVLEMTRAHTCTLQIVPLNGTSVLKDYCSASVIVPEWVRVCVCVCTRAHPA